MYDDISISALSFIYHPIRPLQFQQTIPGNEEVFVLRRCWQKRPCSSHRGHIIRPQHYRLIARTDRVKFSFFPKRLRKSAGWKIWNMVSIHARYHYLRSHLSSSSTCSICVPVLRSARTKGTTFDLSRIGVQTTGMYIYMGLISWRTSVSASPVSSNFPDLHPSRNLQYVTPGYIWPLGP